MSSIDERIVEMRFDNGQFQKGISTTTSSLDALKKSLDMTGATKGLNNLDAAVGKINLSSIADGVDNIASKFSAMGAIAFTALQKLTNMAFDVGKKIGDAIWQPLVEGGAKRAHNIEQANFSFTMMGVNAKKAMADALYAVKGTAFGLDSAAKAAASLSASSIKLGPDMKASLRGISGVAAVTGSSYEDISNVFTKVAGQGRLMGDDLNSLGARGLNAAAVLGKSMHTTQAAVRDMVSDGKISFLQFAKVMDKVYGSKSAAAAKTYSGALGNMNTALSRVGASFAASHFEKQRIIFNAITPQIDALAAAIQPLVDLYGKLSIASGKSTAKLIKGLDFTDLTNSMPHFVGAIQNVLKAVEAVAKPIADAWHQVFPPTQSKIITNFAIALEKFTAQLIISANAASGIKALFIALFTALKFGVSITVNIGKVLFNAIGLILSLIKSVTGLITPLFGLFDGFNKKSKSSTDSITAVGDAIVWLQNAALKPLITMFTNMGFAFDAFLKGDKKGAVTALGKAFEPFVKMGALIQKTFKEAGVNVVNFFKPLVDFGKSVADVWNGTLQVFKNVWNFVQPIAAAIWNVVKGLGSALTDQLKNVNINTVLAAINSGILLYLGKGLFKSINSLTHPFSAVADAFNGLTDTLKNAQKELKSTMLIKIAAAILILAIALTKMASVDPKRLGAATLAMGALMTGLMYSMKAFANIASMKELAKLPTLTLALIGLATSLNIMASALVKVSQIKTDNLIKGLIGITVAMGLLVGAAVVLSHYAKEMTVGAIGLNLMSAAINTLAIAVTVFGLLPTDKLEQGLGAVSFLLGVLVTSAVLLSKFAKSMILSALGITAMAVALNLLIVPITTLGLIPMHVIGQGMGALALALGGLVLAALAISKIKGDVIQAAGAIALMAFALGQLVIPITALGILPFDTVVQGIASLALMLAVMVAAANALEGSISGAASMLIMAVAIAALSVSLALLAAIDPIRLVTAMLALAVAIIGFAAAADLLATSLPAMEGLAIVLLTVSVSILAISGAFMVFALAMNILGPAIVGITKGLQTFAAASNEIIAAVPAMLAVGAGLIIFGAGAAVAGVGVIVLGAGLVVLGVGLALIAAIGPIAAIALLSVVTQVVALMQYAGQLAIMGAAFLALGAGLVVLGAGLVLVGAGLIVVGAGIAVIGAGLVVVAVGIAAIAGGLILFGMAAPVAAAGLTVLAAAATANVNAIGPLVGLAIGIGAFGLAAGLAGIGAGIFAIALMTLATGLLLMAAVGDAGTKALTSVAASMGGLLKYLIPMGLMAVGFAALGAAAVVLGSGLVLIGAGITVIAGGVGLLVVEGMLAVVALKLFISSLSNLIKMSGKLDGATSSLNHLASSIGKVASAGASSAAGLNATAAAMNVVNSSVGGVSKQMGAATGSIKSSVPQISSALTTAANSFKTFASSSKGSLTSFTSNVSSTAPKAVAAAKKMASDVVTGITGKMKSSQGALEGAARSAGSFIAIGLSSGILNGRSQVISAAISLAASAITAANRTLDIHSPSKEFVKIGNFVTQGFVKGMQAGLPSVQSTFDTLKSMLNDFLNTSNANLSKAKSNLAKAQAAQKKNAQQIKDNNKDIADTKKEIAADKAKGKSTKAAQRHLDTLLKTQKKLAAARKTDAAAVKSAAKTVSQYSSENAKGKEVKEITQSDPAKDYAASAKATRDADAKATKAAKAKVATDNKAIAAKKKQIAQAKKQGKSTKTLTKDLSKLTATQKKDTAAVKTAVATQKKAPTGNAAKDLATDKARVKADNKAIATTKKQLAAAKKIKKPTKAQQKATAALTAKLKSQTAARTKDLSAQAKAQKAVNDIAAAKKYNAQKTQLTALGKQFDALTTKIDDATTAYNDAVKQMADYNSAVHDQYDTLVDFDKDTNLTDFMTQMQQKIDDTKKMAADLNTLRSMGLNDAWYKDFVGKGTDAIPFMDQLINSGYASIDQLNSMSDQLDSLSTDMGDTTSTELYQAGVNAAKGLVDGLKSQQDAIQAQMDTIAKSMVDTLKKELGIHSPSVEMAKLGNFATQGLIKGLNDSMSDVEASSTALANTTLDTLRNTLSSSMGSLEQIDMNPTITPVLDLSNIQQQADKIDGLLSPSSISVPGSYQSAVAAKAAYTASVASSADGTDKAKIGGVTFIQNNNSPKSLSTSEIYRQTNNQLSRAKEALTT